MVAVETGAVDADGFALGQNGPRFGPMDPARPERRTPRSEADHTARQTEPGGRAVVAAGGIGVAGPQDASDSRPPQKLNRRSGALCQL